MSNEKIDGNYQYVVSEIEYMDIKQRWIVVYSSAANHRATKMITRQAESAKEKIQKELFHLQAQRFACKKMPNER